MSDEIGRRQPQSHTSAAAVLDDENLLTEILLRLPPRPSSLPRASCVSKRWKRIVTGAGFFRRFRGHHRVRPLIGVYEKQGRTAFFKPVLDAPDRIPPERFNLWVGDKFEAGCSMLGCRHGRVLAMCMTQSMLIVFHPVSGDRRIMTAPNDFVGTGDMPHGAVLCVAGGDDQNRDHLSLFKVVMVGISRMDHRRLIARVYCSETRRWGNLISTEESCPGYITRLPCTLIGNALYWLLNNSEDGILEFDLSRESLAVIKIPPVGNVSSGLTRIIRADNGSVGFAMLSWPSFQSWDRNVNCHGDATWVLQKTVKMHEVLGLESQIAIGMATILAYSEEAHAVLISVHNSVFMVELESMQPTKLHEMFLENIYYPFSDFYPSGNAQNAARAIEAPRRWRFHASFTPSFI